MAFFPTTNTAASPFDLDCAERLVAAVKHAHRIQRPFNRDKWALDFKRLRTVDKVDEARISNVLAWYICHMLDQFMPQAYSGEGFRNKFLAIEQAYRRAVPLVGELTEGQRMLVTRLQQKGWPAGSKTKLPQCVQTSWEAYTTWRDKAVAYDGSLPSGHQDLSRFLLGKFTAPGHFIENWFDAIHKDVANWEAWSGNLEQFVFTETSPRFHRMLSTWCVQYCSNPGRYHNYMREVNAHADSKA